MEEKYWGRDTDLQLCLRGKEGHCNERCGWGGFKVQEVWLQTQSVGQAALTLTQAAATLTQATLTPAAALTLTQAAPAHQQQAKVHCTAARGPSWNDKILSWEIG